MNDDMWLSLWREQLLVAGPAWLDMVAGAAPWDPILAGAALSAAELLDQADAGLRAAAQDDEDDELSSLLGEVLAVTSSPAGRRLVERTVDATDLDAARYVLAPVATGEDQEDHLEAVVEVAALAALSDPDRARRVGASRDADVEAVRRAARRWTPDLDAPDELPPHLLQPPEGDEEPPPLSEQERALLAEREVEEQRADLQALASALALPSSHPVAAYLRALDAALSLNVRFVEAPLARQFEAYAHAVALPEPVPYEAVREELEARLPPWVRTVEWLRRAPGALAAWVERVVPALEGPAVATASTEAPEELLSSRFRLVSAAGGELALVRRGRALLVEWLGDGEAPSAVAVSTAGGAVELTPTTGPLADQGAAYWELDVPPDALEPPTLIVRSGGAEEVVPVAGPSTG